MLHLHRYLYKPVIQNDEIQFLWQVSQKSPELIFYAYCSFLEYCDSLLSLPLFFLHSLSLLGDVYLSQVTSTLYILAQHKYSFSLLELPQCLQNQGQWKRILSQLFYYSWGSWISKHARLSYMFILHIFLSSGWSKNKISLIYMNYRNLIFFPNKNNKLFCIISTFTTQFWTSHSPKMFGSLCTSVLTLALAGMQTSWAGAAWPLEGMVRRVSACTPHFSTQGNLWTRESVLLEAQ